MTYTDMEQYWIWLSSIDGLGVKRFYQLLSEYEDPRAVWDNVGSGMQFLGRQTYANLVAARTERYLYELFGKLERLQIRAVSRIAEDYPPGLSNIFDPPPVLYVKGDADLTRDRLFGIVGSRTPTTDGRRAATEIARGLSRAGVAVVSGLARGTDTCAHVGCLEGGAPTIAVLGCGVDVAYPPENDRLYQRILDEGGAIMSEYSPGTPPLGQHFPARNRIISGLCPGVLIVEAAVGSGAMITANNALEQDRDVFVVPGSIYSKLSAEPNRLLTQGAVPVLSEWEVLEYYGWGERPGLLRKANKPRLSEDESKIVEPLESESLSFDELSQMTDFLPSKLNSLLTMLELRGIIDKVPGGRYRYKG